jgi:hypothetical protein
MHIESDLEKRDLSFIPVINDSPKSLTVDQIDSYNENGYLKPLEIFSDQEVIKNREFFDNLLTRLNNNNGGDAAYSINGYHVRCEAIWDIVIDPRILDCVEDLIGPDIIAWGSHYFCKLPLDRKAVPWHQDASYWPLSPARTVTVWLAIDDADAENAAMQFIPGTHIRGHLDWEKTEKLAVLSQEIPNVTRYGKPVMNNLKAGEISLHADMMVHGSTPNDSMRRRCGLTIRYCPPEVKVISNRDKDKGYGMQAILCRGKNRYEDWKCNPRPQGNDWSPLK